MKYAQEIDAQVLDAIAFAILHEDGQIPDNLQTVDVAFIGLSRASKTPTALHMAWKYVKNIWCVPFFPGCNLTSALSLPRDRIIVITISPEELQIRRQLRLAELGSSQKIGVGYANIDSVIKECNALINFCELNRLNGRVVDVSGKGIENTSFTIAQKLRWRASTD